MTDNIIDHMIDAQRDRHGFWHVVCDCGWTDTVIDDDSRDQTINAHLDTIEED